MNNLSKQFLLIDDDPVSNFLLRKVLEKNLTGAQVKDFLEPELALKYIEAEATALPTERKTTIFLDINMPTLTGWEFLDAFDAFSNKVKDHFSIYILSSSIDPADIQRAQMNPLVIRLIQKPLKKEFLLENFAR